MPKFRTYSQISEWREKESSDFMLVKQYAEDSIRFDEPILEKWTHLYRGIVYCSISWEGAGKVKSMAILKLDPKYVV